MNAYQKFCVLRDQRRAGEEAPEFTELEAFEAAIAEPLKAQQDASAKLQRISAAVTGSINTPFDEVLNCIDLLVEEDTDKFCKRISEKNSAQDTNATTRLRSIVDLLGLQSSVPDGDLTGYEFSVLGFVRREIERLKAAAQPTPAQGDAVPVAVRRALELYADSYDMMARIGKTGDVDCKSVAFDIRKNMVDSVIDALSKATDATRQSSADAGDAARMNKLLQCCTEFQVKYHRDQRPCQMTMVIRDSVETSIGFRKEMRKAIDQFNPIAIAEQDEKGDQQ